MPLRTSSTDLYRRVPTDLLEDSKKGSILSLLTLVTMTVLFFLETKSFFGSERLVSVMSLDPNDEPNIQIRFNITMMDMKCAHATIDIKSDLGTEQNVTQHVNKMPIDAEGVRRMVRNKNKRQRDLLDIVMKDESVKETIEELHENGEDAVSLDAAGLKYAQNKHAYVFVDFFASWCSHCRDLAPTWETLAEVMDTAAEETFLERIKGKRHRYTDAEFADAKKVSLPVMIAKVDCVEHKELCIEQGIKAYPTLRVFVDGERYAEYNGHRTVIEMVHWLDDIEKEHEKDKDLGAAKEIVKNIELTEEEKKWSQKLEKHRHLFSATSPWRDEDHPGCQLSGILNVDRSPGNFHIVARSKTHQFDPHLTNVSHEVHHLSFGKIRMSVFMDGKYAGDVPDDFLESTHPMDGNVYVTKNLHEAHHHYLKVITTVFGMPGERNYAYRILPSSQLSLFSDDTVPEAKFVYDLSPISISYEKTYMNWYDYITSVMAIVGGAFTIVGMLESSIHAATSKKNR